MRRRVMLERAAWQLGAGRGHRRGVRRRLRVGRGVHAARSPAAYGHPPSAPATRRRQPLAARAERHPLPPADVAVGAHRERHDPAADLLVHHDLDDTRGPARDWPRAERRGLPARAAGRQPGRSSRGRSDVAAVLTSLVFTKEVWLARDPGDDFPAERPDDVGRCRAARRRRRAWLATVRDIERRAPGTTGSSTRSATRRELRARQRRRPRPDLLRAPAARRPRAAARAGVEADDGDPINWLRRTRPHEDDLLHRHHARRLHRRRARLARLAVQQPQDEDGPINYEEFIEDVGAIAMGATTYEWVRRPPREVRRAVDVRRCRCWVFTHREFEPIGAATSRFTTGAGAPRCTPR